MPNWTKIAETIARGEFGEEWDKQKMRKAEIDSAAQRSRLLESAESRAQSAEGRAQDEFGWSKQQRPMLLEDLQNKVKAGKLSVEQAQNVIETFDASGGAKGAAKRTDEDHQAKLNESKARVSQAQNAVAMAKNENERQAALHKYQVEKAKLEEEIGTATKPAIIEQAFDKANPRDRFDTGIGSIASVVSRGGLDDSQKNSWLGRMEGLLDMQKQADEERKARQAGATNKIPGAQPRKDRFDSKIQTAPPPKRSFWDFFGLDDEE
jgi:Ulp1 family protease